MTPEKTQRLALLANQLAENLMTVAICAEELRATIRAELDPKPVLPAMRGSGRLESDQPQGRERPLVDHSTLSVLWDGRTCQLGYTVLFKLVDRLSRRPNQFVTFDHCYATCGMAGFARPTQFAALFGISGSDSAMPG